MECCPEAAFQSRPWTPTLLVAVSLLVFFVSFVLLFIFIYLKSDTHIAEVFHPPVGCSGRLSMLASLGVAGA